MYEYARAPPSLSELTSTLDVYGVPSKIYQVPYYYIEIDAPERPSEYAGLVFKLKGGVGVGNLEPFSSSVDDADSSLDDVKLRNTSVHGWEYAGVPPSVRQARAWLKTQEARAAFETRKKSSQVRECVSGTDGTS